MEENIIRLKVTMHNVILIQNLKSLKQLLKYQQRIFLIQNALLPQHSLQGPTIAVLINKVKIVLSFEHIKIVNNVAAFLNIR